MHSGFFWPELRQLSTRAGDFEAFQISDDHRPLANPRRPPRCDRTPLHPSRSSIPRYTHGRHHVGAELAAVPGAAISDNSKITHARPMDHSPFLDVRPEPR